MLARIQENAPHKRTPWKIQRWSAYLCERGPDHDVEALEMFSGRMNKFNPKREDVKTCSACSISTITPPLAAKRRQNHRGLPLFKCEPPPPLRFDLTPARSLSKQG